MTELIENVIEIARLAGEEILQVYNHSEFSVETKGDGSPLTEADRRAHQVIEAALEKLTPDIPILSEESGAAVFAQRHQWDKFWLVDPLDGTKEFVKRNGEFTVNIALIDNTRPRLGVVHTPVQGITHFGDLDQGAFKKDNQNCISAIRVRPLPSGSATMVASRSHGGEKVDRFRHALENIHGDVEIVSMGSSLKLCLVAEGKADIYPRLGPTSEWDTAAAHCVVEAAGGAVVNLEGEPLQYNKRDILNPWFLVYGDSSLDWSKMLD